MPLIHINDKQEYMESEPEVNDKTKMGILTINGNYVHITT